MEEGQLDGFIKPGGHERVEKERIEPDGQEEQEPEKGYMIWDGLECNQTRLFLR